MNTVASAPSEQRLLVLAGRWERLNAWLIDWLLNFPVLSLGLSAGLGFMPFTTRHLPTSAEWTGFSVLVAFLIAQSFLLVKRGQTIGKWLCGVRIVDAVDASRVGFVRIVLLRYVVPISAALGGQLLGLGNLVFFVDALWIVGEEQRCLHDHLAHTRVVRCLGDREMRAELLRHSRVASRTGQQQHST